jgi:hypothetical protein
MIPERENQALTALHRVLIEARLMALEEEPVSEIAEVLDWAELLPQFLAAEEDKTDDFLNALQAIAHRQPRFDHAIGAFNRPQPLRWRGRRSGCNRT